MLNMIYSELLKLKNTYMIIIVLIGGTVSTVIMVLARFISSEHMMTFEKYAYNIEQMNFLILYIVLFSIIVSFVFSREFTDKTASVLYSYPTSRIKIFMSKLITVYILIFIVYVIEIASIPLGYYFLTGSIPAESLMIRDIKANLYSLFFQFLLIPIPVLIANISKNNILPIVYGILGFISTAYMSDADDSLYGRYYPLLSPFFSAKYFYNSERINLNCITIIGTSCFILFLFISIYEFNKKDID